MVSVTSEIFLQLGLVFIIAAAAGYLLRALRQPQILAYVLVGILITPVLGIVTDTSIIESLSLIGIAFLLFLVGMEMDLKALKSVVFVSGVGGLIQVIILFVLGYLAALLLGFLSLEAAYLGLMLAFSSTMVVLKLLSDKRELNTLHGRIAVGILLLQDIVAIFALSLMSSLNGFSFSLLGIALVKFLSLFAIAFVLSKYLFPHIFRFAARHQELLLVTSLGVCFLFSLGFFYLGFSIAIGAFIAGVALGNLQYSLDIISKVRSLRDFFSLLFFVSLGMGISLGVVRQWWIPLLVLLGITLAVKPLVIMTICSLFKYTKKPAFLTANSLAQIGEFSLILAAQGLVLGHITQELFSLVVITALISITLTSYFIQYDKWFYKLFERPLKIFEVFHAEGLEYLPSEVRPKIILCGYNRIGYSILESLRRRKKEVLIVDFNPEVIDKLVRGGYHCIYGDATDDEITERMNLKNILMLISTVPEVNDNIHLIKKVRSANKKAKVIVTAPDIDEALKLYDQGAHYVILPHFLGGEHVSHLLDRFQRRKIDLHEERKKHVSHLYERKRMGHSHPKQ